MNSQLNQEQRIELVRNKIADLTERLTEANDFILQAGTSDDHPQLSARQLNDLRVQIDNFQADIKRQRQMLALYDPSENSETARLAFEKRKEIQRLINIKTAKLFENGSMPDIYWRWFSDFCATHAVTGISMPLLLRNFVSSRTDGDLWYNTNVSQIENTITKKELEDSFIGFFGEKNWKSQRILSLTSILYPKNSHPTVFRAKFSEAVINAGLPWENDGPGAELAKAIYFHRHPQSVQRLIDGKDPVKDFNSCKQLSELLCSFTGIPNDIPSIQFLCPGCDTRVRWSCPNTSCRVGKAHTITSTKVSTSSSTPSEKNPHKRKVETSKNLCKYCKKAWTTDHRCEEYREAKRSKNASSSSTPFKSDPSRKEITIKGTGLANSAMTVGAGPIIEYVYESDEFLVDVPDAPVDLSAMSTEINNKHNCKEALFYAPCLLSNTRVMAAIDSKCNASMISPSFAKQCQLEVIPYSVPIKLGVNGLKGSTIGITKPTQLNWGAKIISHSFIVADLSGTDQLLIGADLFESLGINLSGLPLMYPVQQVKKESIPTPETKITKSFTFVVKDSYISLIKRLKNKKPSEEELQLYREYLLSYLKDLLIRNESCSGICNIPGAEVPIDTKSSKPSRVNQYRIPFHKRALVDQQVAKWLEDGIIERQQDMSVQWNNPILVVDKKNSAGVKTGGSSLYRPQAN